MWLTVATEAGTIDRFVDNALFSASASGESLARFDLRDPRLLPAMRPMLGGAGIVPLAARLLITEVNYNPAEPSSEALAIAPDIVSSDLEFVELQNNTTSQLQLTGWRLRGDVDFDFDDGQFLFAGEVVLVTPFNPNNVNNEAKLEAFRAHYGIDTDVRILGGYDGQLSNGGGRIRIDRPDAPPADEPGP